MVQVSPLKQAARLTGPEVATRSGGRELVLALGVVALAIFPYLVGGISRTFIPLDDQAYIYGNPQVRKGLTLQTALWALASMEHANWYPLRRISHLVDVSLFGFNAVGHHLLSIGWHTAAGLLLFIALRKLTGMSVRSFVVAGLFVAHPLQVESVAWASERSNVLAGFFLSLTLLLWVIYSHRPRAGSYSAVLLSCALGLAAKPALVPLPLLLLLLDFWPLGRMSPPGSPPWQVTRALLLRRVLEKVPLLLLAVAPSAIAILAHRRTGALWTLDSLPLGPRFANAVLSYWRYVGKLLWPVDLAVFYPHPGGDFSFRVACAALLLVGVTIAVILYARRHPYLFVSWLWFAGMLAPTIGIVQFSAQGMADRFAYLPSIGFFLLLVWLTSEILSFQRRAVIYILISGAVLVALSVVSANQAGYWQESERLFRHSLAVTGDNWVILNELGVVLQEKGRHEEAIDNFRKSVQLNPGYIKARVNLGISLHELERQRKFGGNHLNTTAKPF